MSSEKDVKVTVEACGEVHAFECHCATVTTVSGDSSVDAYFVGASSPRDIVTLAAAGIDTVIEALRLVGIPYGLALKLILDAVLGADPHGHADSVQTTDRVGQQLLGALWADLDARRVISDMAAELGVDADL